MLNDDSSSSSSSEDEEMIVRTPKIYRRRQQHLSTLDDPDFFDRFRLTKPTVLSLLQKIANSSHFPSNKGSCIDPMNQLLLTLRFYATGNTLITTGDFTGISKISASRIIRRVSFAIASLCPQYIKMCEDDNEMQAAAEKFYAIANFPRVIGAIDCTPIKIAPPGGDDPEIFRCPKNFFALNVQTVCDSELRIRNIVARWPGSTDDQTVFDNSGLKSQFESGQFGQYLLLGDSDYSLETYLMTTLTEAQTAAENSYNESIIRTRNVVERMYRVWKCRFPILSNGTSVKLTTIRAIIVATAVLHNIAIDMNEIFPNEWLYDVQEKEEFRINPNNEARQVRRLIINEHFAPS